MKKFLCICLSPAIDATVRLPAWPTDGCILKDAREVLAPGGKGLNVARWLALRGAQVACGGLLGADNATPFEKEMAKYGIEDRFVRVPGVTRVNEMFVSPQGSFKVNRPAFPGVTAGLDETAALVAAGGWDCVVMSGSLPRDYPADAYRTLVEADQAERGRMRAARGLRAVLAGRLPPRDGGAARVLPHADHLGRRGRLLVRRRVRRRARGGGARHDRRWRHAPRRVVLLPRFPSRGRGRQRGLHDARRPAPGPYAG